jgi:hypothetical protein
VKRLPDVEEVLFETLLEPVVVADTVVKPVAVALNAEHFASPAD